MNWLGITQQAQGFGQLPEKKTEDTITVGTELKGGQQTVYCAVAAGQRKYVQQDRRFRGWCDNKHMNIDQQTAIDW